MLRICEIKRKESVLLNEIDSYLYSEEIEIKNDKIFISFEMQQRFISENINKFYDLTVICKEILKCQDWTVLLVDSITKEEKEVTIEIEGGI